MVLDILLCPADAVDEVVASAHRAVGVHHHIVCFFHVEGRAVSHTNNLDAFAHRVFVGHFIDDARSTIEVVDGILHLVGIFEEVFHFLACQGHDGQGVFEGVPSEKVLHSEFSCFNGFSATEWSGHGNVGMDALGFNGLELAAVDFVNPEA